MLSRGLRHRLRVVAVSRGDFAEPRFGAHAVGDVGGRWPLGLAAVADSVSIAAAG